MSYSGFMRDTASHQAQVEETNRQRLAFLEKAGVTVTQISDLG